MRGLKPSDWLTPSVSQVELRHRLISYPARHAEWRPTAVEHPNALFEELGGTIAGEALRAQFPILKRLRDDG